MEQFFLSSTDKELLGISKQFEVLYTPSGSQLVQLLLPCLLIPYNSK